ncbi:hypothetical protein [uncultured Corynebacterium sp.]|uniref:hypothetical protein n=1 Tax=uncultured Corynebacterium sp. TaxID=159447 RepID=UPI0025D1F986|nr:hypothetical protein [uncultured Corynebacterium sp.]
MTTAPNTRDTATIADSGHAIPTYAIPDGPEPGFLDLLKSEIGRLLNLRSTWGYAIAILAFIVGLPVAMWAVTQGRPAEFRYEPTFVQLLLGTDLAVIAAMIFAAAGSASDISGRRVAFGYLASNNRIGVHVARLVAQVLIVAAVVLVGFAVAAGILGVVGALVPEDLGQAFVVIGILVLWTAIGSAVGMLVPVTAVAVGAPIAWVFVIEMAISTVPVDFLQTMTKYLPWVASRHLGGMMDIGVSDVHAGLVLAVWSVVVIGAGLFVAARRDVK